VLAPAGRDPRNVVETASPCHDAVHRDSESPSQSRPGVRLRLSLPLSVCVTCTVAPPSIFEIVMVSTAWRMLIVGPNPGAVAGLPFAAKGASGGIVHVPERSGCCKAFGAIKREETMIKAAVIRMRRNSIAVRPSRLEQMRRAL
jgi:hypothetical protein